jgi:hypothetical protein
MPQDNESGGLDKTNIGDNGGEGQFSSSRVFASSSMYSSSDDQEKSLVADVATNHQETFNDDANGASCAQRQEAWNDGMMAEDVTGTKSMEVIATYSDLPGYVQRHRNDLTFPEKVCCDYFEMFY